MDARLIAIAVPFFFALIGIERFITRRWKDPAYSLFDSFCNLSCGIGEQVIAITLEVVFVGSYVYVFERWALFSISMKSPLAWAGALLGVDFLYYWFHRASHRVNFIWATHAVHHQSEEYNLSVALRQSWLQHAFTMPFYWILAVIGFPPVMFITMVTIDTLYQFWIHTRMVGKLGPFEWIFNTPSHHRVHHGINPKYIDKNYAGLLIVWDRLFGTFQEEEEEPTYGTVKPLASFNPTWANAQYWVEIAHQMKACDRFVDALYTPFAPPEWRPGGNVVIPEASREKQKRYAVRPAKPVRIYVTAIFVQSTLITLALLVFQRQMTAGGVTKLLLFASIGMVLWMLTTLSGLVEKKWWAPPLESLRLGALAGMALALVGVTSWGGPLAISVGLLAVGMAGWLRWIRPSLA